MKTSLWIARSQQFYRRLLRLYPQTHRAAYEMEMFHLFTDQCRDACEKHGRTGLLSLWLRTLGDAAVTIFREHLTDPNAKLGLLDASPNTQLPWKGVALVLIPGLIFFIAQIAQLSMSGGDLFFVAFYRAAYIVAVPVILIWLFARRFPVWGLMPLGLLYETLWVLGRNVHYGVLREGSAGVLALKYPFIDNILSLTEKYSQDVKTVVMLLACLVLLLLLIGYNVHQRRISRNAWRWLGLYGLLIVFQTGFPILHYIATVGGWSTFWQDPWNRYYLFLQSTWSIYEYLPFLALIFLGTLFVHRYGVLSFLVPLGFLLPAVVFGRYGEWTDTLPFYVVAVVVVAYRFAIALAAPLGLARSASLRKQRLAVAIPIALAILAQIGLDVSQLVLWAQQYGYQLFAYNLSEIILSQLITGAGLALAVVLYQYQPQIDNASLTTLPGVPAPADQLVISTPVRDLQIEQ
jgi:hypothetical protein